MELAQGEDRSLHHCSTLGFFTLSSTGIQSNSTGFSLRSAIAASCPYSGSPTDFFARSAAPLGSVSDSVAAMRTHSLTQQCRPHYGCAWQRLPAY